ncbi:MAG: hypothetical protein R3F43_04755 [bacterium]
MHANSLPDAEIVDRMRGWARLISGRSSFFVALAGVDIAEETRLADVLQVVEGDLDGLKQPGTVALFVRQAARLEVGIGDELTLSAATLGGADNTADLRVVAIIRDVGSSRPSRSSCPSRPSATSTASSPTPPAPSRSTWTTPRPPSRPWPACAPSSRRPATAS